MGEITDRLAQLKAQREAQQDQTRGGIEKARQNFLDRREAKLNPNKPKFTGNVDDYANAKNQDYIDQQAGKSYAEKYMPNADYTNSKPQVEGSDIAYKYETALSKMGKAFNQGVGEVISGWGDVLQMASSLGYTTGDGWDENPLQRLGEMIKEANAMNPDTNFADSEMDLIEMMKNPEFWLTEAPKAIPQLIDMLLIGRGVGAVVKGGTKLGAKALIKEVAEEGAETLAKKFASRSGKSLSGTVKGVYEGAEDITQLGGGKSALRHIFNDQGKLTNLGKTFEEIATSAGAGFASNVKVGMMNGTEMFNTYANTPKIGKDGKPVLDENGNPVMAFSQEQAGEMARNAFFNNLAYAAIDMASYGITFGSNKFLGKTLSSVGDSGKIFGGMFAKTAKYLPINQTKWAAKAGFEGVEESLQETWEEWAKLKAYHDTTGSLEGYQGKVPKGTKVGDGDTGVIAALGSYANFLDFYKSDEMKGLRNLSGILGGVMGGGANIKQLLSKQAEDAYNAYRRSDALSRRQAEGTEGAMLQEKHIRAVINESVMQGKQEYMVDYITNLAKKGIISEEQQQYYARIYDQSVAELNRVQNIKSLSGKVAYMNNHATENQYMEEIQRSIEEAKANKQVIEQTITNEADKKKALKAEEEALASKIDNFSAIITAAQNNKQALLAGKAASELNVDYDPKTGMPKFNNKFYSKEANKALKGWQQNRRVMRQKAEQEAFNKKQEESMSEYQKYDRQQSKTEREAQKEYDSAMETLNKETEQKYADIDSKIAEQAENINLKGREITQDDIDTFKNNRRISKDVAEALAYKKLMGEPLTEDEQKMYGANKRNINKLVNKNSNNPAVEEIKKLKQERSDIENSLVEKTAEIAKNRDEKIGTRLTEEQFNEVSKANKNAVDDSIEDDVEEEEVFSEKNNPELMKSAIDDYINGDPASASNFDPDEYEAASEAVAELENVALLLQDDPNITLTKTQQALVDNNQEAFERIAKENGIDNASQLYRDNQSKIAGLSEKQKQFVDNVVNKFNKKNFDKAKNKAKKVFDKAKKVGKEVYQKGETLFTNPNNRFKLDEETETETEETAETEQSSSTESKKDYRQKVREKAEKLRKDAKAAAKKLAENQGKKANKKARSLWSGFRSKADDLSHVRYSHGTIVEQIHAQRKLRAMYPNSNLHVAIVDDLTKLSGVRTLGMAAHGVIYVDARAWNNNNRTFFHEVAHINFALSKGEKPTQDLIEELIKNTELVNDLEDKYWQQVQYEVPATDFFEGGIVYPKDIAQAYFEHTGEVIETRKRFNEVLEQMIKDGEVVKRPLKDQEVIIDELFATTLEYTYDHTYKNFLFENYTADEWDAKHNPNKDTRGWLKRQFHKRTGIDKLRRLKEKFSNWLGWVKDQAKKSDPQEEMIRAFQDSLSDADEKRYSNLKDTVINHFVSGSSVRFTNPEVRYKLLDELEKAEGEERIEIEKRIAEDKKRIAEAIKESNRRLVEGQNEQDELTIAEQEENDEIENETQHAEAGNDLWNSVDKLKALKKTSGTVKEFSKVYNKALRKMYFENHKAGTRWNIPSFDGDQLLVDLYNLAAQSESDVDFIQQIENSYGEMDMFNDYLETVHDNKMSYLSNFYMLAKDVALVESVQGYVNDKGVFELQSSMSMKENYLYDKTFDHIQKMYSAAELITGKTKQNYFSLTPDRAQGYYGSFQVMTEAMNRIYNGKASYSDISTVAKYFGATDNVIAENILYMDGTKVPLDAAVVGLVKRLGNTFAYKEDNKVKTPVIKFIRAAVVSNKKYTAEFTVQNAEGNQTPARIVKGHINHKFEQMTRDATNLTRTQFINKYSRIKGTGSKGNNLLGFMWDRAQKGRPVGLSLFNGIKNDKTNKYSTYDNNNANDNSIMEFFTYMSTASKNGSYMMETGRYADSPLSYMMEVPNNNIDDFGKFDSSTGKFTFSGKNAGLFVQAVNTYNHFYGENIKPADMKTILEEAIESEQEFLNDNKESLKSNPSLERYLNDDGTLNSNGKRGVASYVINNFLNTMSFNQVFMPDISGKDFTKRAKGLRAPGYTMGKNVKSEIIYFKDDLVGGTELDDSGMYILEDDAVRIQEAFGDVLQVGKGYKLLHAGMETNNKNFQGNNFYDKGYTTILNEEYVAQNPSLRGLYETMKRRRENYIKKYGPIEQSLAGDQPTYIGLAVPMSANKMKNAQGEYVLDKRFETKKVKDANGKNTDQYVDNSFTLDYFNDANNNADIDSMFDSMYYDGDSFMGLSGENLKLQQKMDKIRFNSNFPIQTLKAVISEGSVRGDMAELERIQSLITEQEQENLQKIYNVVVNGSAEEVLEVFKNGNSELPGMIDKDQVNVLQKFLLDDGLSINTPAIRELAINTFLNHVRRNGNKLSTPGSIAQQKPAKHVKRARLKDGSYTNHSISTNGSKGLSFYEKDHNGNNRPGEAVVPSYLKGKLKARQYRLFSESDNTQMIEYANLSQGQIVNNDGYKSEFSIPQGAVSYAKGVLKEAQKAGKIPNDMNVDQFMELYKVVNDNTNTVIGYYIPGDTFMATRIPSHGVQSTGFFEVVDYDPTGASQIQLPFEFAQNVTGGDYDGDQVFMQYKDEDSAKWNEAFDLMKKRWLSSEMNEEVKKSIEFEDDAKQAISEIEKNLGKATNKKLLVGTPEYRRQSFNDTLVSKNNVGQSANYHSYVSMLSAYNIGFGKPITIDGVSKSMFDETNENRSINSAKILNLVLDNAKEAFADSLGINQETVGDAIILTQLGFSLGQIGTILNSKSYIDANKRSAARRNTFADSVFESVDKTKADIVINTKKLSRTESSPEVDALIQLIGDIKSDLSDLSTIMAGHTRIETDPFILTEQIQAYETLLQNKKENQVLNISKEFRDNPLVQNYLNTAKVALEVREKYDPASREDYKQVYGELTSSARGNISKAQKRKLHEDFEKFALSRLLGWNNISEEYKRSLVDKKGVLNIFDRLLHYSTDLKYTPASGDTYANVVSQYDANILFSKALSFNARGNNQYISLNSSFYSDTMTNEERELAIAQFKALPADLRKDLLIYDMMTNGWKGPKSLFHLMDLGFTKEVSKLSDQDIRTKDFDKLSPEIKRQLNVAVAELNQKMFPSFGMSPFRNYTIQTDSEGRLQNLPKDGLKFNGWFFNKQGVDNTENLNMAMKFSKGKPVSFFTYFKNGQGVSEKYYVQIGALSPERMMKLKELYPKLNPADPKAMASLLSFALPTLAKDGTMRVTKVSNDMKIGYEKLTSISDNKTEKEIKTFKDAVEYSSGIDTSEKIDWNNSPSNVRYKKQDWYNYENTLERADFDNVMEFESFVSESSRAKLYKDYLNAKKQADKIAVNFTQDRISSLSTDVLIEHYNKFGNENQYAYANILGPIVREIGERISKEQTEKYTQVEEDNKDISAVKKWMMANNIPSNHPMVQALVRNMETQHKIFTKEKGKYQTQLNDATNALYKEKFGYIMTGGTLKDRVKALWDYLFKNKEKMYEELYGNLITYDLVQKNRPDGSPYTMRVLKYKTKEQIQADHAAGKISDTELKFYETTSAIANDLGKYATLKNGKRADFIPHAAAGQMEAFSRRGFLGLMVGSKTIDARIGDVRMDYKNPFTGEVMKNVRFSDIDTMFNIATADGKQSVRAMDYYKLKLKAIKLLKKGKNEDGSELKLSSIDMGTAIGDTFMDRFSNSGTLNSNLMPTLDLNKAFSDYIHTSLFVNGNEQFAGYKKMLPLVDGALARLDKKGMKNMSAYVQKVWKDNFLKGAKQRSLKTPSHLEAFGVTSDKVIDFITKGSLVYWLGYKGLALGAGLYAVGNVLNGKFNNVAHAGGKAWVQGEKRFWLGKDGKFNLRDPFKGIREANAILKKAGFMDVNLSDDVGVTNQNTFDNFFMNMALFPMTYSERWIQGVHFLGMLDDEQWTRLSRGEDNVIEPEKMAEIENKIKLSHGKGFQATDQRMIQMYSWGRMMMQFSRHIPTTFYNNFAAKDKDNYGKTHIGAYTQVAKTIQDVVTGRVSPKEFSKYYKALDQEEQQKLKAGLMGFGILATAGALGTFGADNKYVNDLASDVNIFFDYQRLSYKMQGGPALGMINELMR